MSIVDVTVTDHQVVSATWNSERNREWIEGESTTYLADGFGGIQDDTYSLTVTASGINRVGVALEM